MYWPYDPAHPVTKVCTHCGIEKHLMEFHLRYDKGKRRAQCKECRRAQHRRYYRANADKRCAASKRYREENREQCRAYQQRYYAEHRDELLAVARQWHAENRERAQGNQKRWAQRNREKTRAAQRRYRKRNPKKTAIRLATQLLRRAGVLKLDPHCTHCGGSPTEHHHLNYENPYAVVSLCRACHMALHRDQRREEREEGV